MSGVAMLGDLFFFFFFFFLIILAAFALAVGAVVWCRVPRVLSYHMKSDFVCCCVSNQPFNSQSKPITVDRNVTQNVVVSHRYI